MKVNDIKYFDFAYSKHYGEIYLKKAMSLSRVKKSIRDFDLRFSSVVVATLQDRKELDELDEYSRARARAQARRFSFDGDAVEFVAEMGMLADLHCIVKMGNGIVWVKGTNDTSELNIDEKVLNRMLKWFNQKKGKHHDTT